MQLTAAVLYRRALIEFQRLVETDDDHVAHWTELSNAVLAAVMQVQSIVIEQQRRVIEEHGSGQIMQLRADVEESRQYLMALHELSGRVRDHVPKS